MNKDNHQSKAFEKFSRLKVGALFMDMGTGKTKVALDLINSKKHKVDYILWICPVSAKDDFVKEKIKWNYKNLNIDLVGCESIGSSDRIYMETLNKVQNHKTFIIVDESIKIKNIEANRTQRIINMGKYAEYRLVLNGTPITKNVLDLWSQMEFLSHKILNMSYTQFKNTFCEYYVRGKLKGFVKKQYNIEYLISLIRPYIYDCDLELNKKQLYYDISYSMSSGELIEYEQIKEDFINENLFTNTISNTISFLSFTNRLQHFYCNCADKKQKLSELIDSIDGKVIVFVKYLDSIPDGALQITGKLVGSERTAVREQFENESDKVLYITYGCGSYSLNLQFCHNIIFADNDWDYGKRDQAEHRIYRTGQNHDCNYYSLWCGCGCERLIHKSLDKKSKLIDEIKCDIETEGIEKWAKTM